MNRRAHRLLACLALFVACIACESGDPSEPARRSEPATTAAKAIGRPPGPPRARVTVTNPLAGKLAAAVEGRRLFLWYNCYGCHGGRAGGGMGPSLRDAVWLYGSTDQDIFNSIADGRPHGMPAWGLMLPEEQIWQLTAYIRLLGSQNEPDPPPRNPVLPDPDAPLPPGDHSLPRTVPPDISTRP